MDAGPLSLNDLLISKIRIHWIILNISWVARSNQVIPVLNLETLIQKNFLTEQESYTENWYSWMVPSMWLRLMSDLD